MLAVLLKKKKNIFKNNNRRQKTQLAYKIGLHEYLVLLNLFCNANELEVLSYRYRLQTVRSLAGVSLMLRLLWACLRWDDMSVKPSPTGGTTRTGWRLTAHHMSLYRLVFSTQPYLCNLTETSDTDITTTEIIKRRDVGPYGIRSEYCIRKIICPLGVPETPKGNGDSDSPYASALFLRCVQFSIMQGLIDKNHC